MAEGPLRAAAKRLCLPLEELRQGLLVRKVVTGRAARRLRGLVGRCHRQDEIETFLRLDQARATRDGLARMLYGRGVLDGLGDLSAEASSTGW